MSGNGDRSRAAVERRVLLNEGLPAAERQLVHEGRNVSTRSTFEDARLERLRAAMPDESPLKLDKYAADLARQIRKLEGEA